jgi:hypothetical protein
MAKEIINDTNEAPKPERDSVITRSQTLAFDAVVFEQSTSTRDFTRSEAIVLAAAPTEAAAWSAVFEALRRGATLIGGEVRPSAESPFLS